MDKGVLLRFDVPLDRAKAGDPDNYSLDELALQAHVPVRLAAVQGRRHAGHRSARAEPRVSVEGWAQRVHRRAGDEAGDADARRLVARDGGRPTFQESASFTPYELPTFDPRAEGFGDLTVDLSPRATAAARVRRR